MNHPALPLKSRHVVMSPVPAALRRAEPTSNRMTALAEQIAVTIAPATGGIVVAANSETQLGVIFGAACAGAGIAGALGMLLSEFIKEMEIPKLVGLKRLAANWFCGLCSIPFASRVHRHWFPEDDIAIVAGSLAALVALMGVLVLRWWLPTFLRRGKAQGDAYIEDKLPAGDRSVITPAPYRQPETVRLSPPSGQS
jgi:hypothetical protein